MVNVYINYEKKFAFVEFRTGVSHYYSRPHVAYMHSFQHSQPAVCWQQ